MENQEKPSSDLVQQVNDLDQGNPEMDKNDGGQTPDLLPSGLEDLAASLPPKERKEFIAKITRFFSLSMSMQGGRPADPDFLKQQDEHEYQIAVKGIEAQQIDRHEIRSTELVKFKITAAIISGIILVLTIFCGIAMYKDKTDFILELMKAIGFIVAGLGGGAIIFRSKK